MSDLLPQNATTLETALEGSIARISDVPTPVRDTWNPDACPENMLPWLAWAFSVDDWDASWDATQKRNAIKSAVRVQRYKGTIGAVRDALSVLGIDVQVQEWFNQLPAGSPYTFNVLLDASQVGISQYLFAKVLQLLETNKNLRSHMNLLVPSVTTKAPTSVGGVLTMGSETQVSAGTPRYSDGTPALDLLVDAAFNGEASTVAALDLLDNILRVEMPANSWAK
jgi:phage tail P2-like protein